MVQRVLNVLSTSTKLDWVLVHALRACLTRVLQRGHPCVFLFGQASATLGILGQIQNYALYVVPGPTKHYQEILFVLVALRTPSQRRAVPLSRSAYVPADTMALMEGHVVCAYLLPQH